MKNIKFNANNSNINNDNSILKKIIPIITYANADTNKSNIYEENRDKSGVYRWVNEINGKSYIGSSISLSKTFSIYYSLSSLKRETNGSIIIYRALLKYGYSNFSIEILEYCEPSLLIQREHYYIDLLKPEYNIKGGLAIK